MEFHKDIVIRAVYPSTVQLADDILLGRNTLFLSTYLASSRFHEEFHPSIHPSVRPSVRPSIHPFIHSSIDEAINTIIHIPSESLRMFDV